MGGGFEWNLLLLFSAFARSWWLFSRILMIQNRVFFMFPDVSVLSTPLRLIQVCTVNYSYWFLLLYSLLVVVIIIPDRISRQQASWTWYDPSFRQMLFSVIIRLILFTPWVSAHAAWLEDPPIHRRVACLSSVPILTLFYFVSSFSLCNSSCKLCVAVFFLLPPRLCR